MKTVSFEEGWHDSWKLSYHYDQQEIYGDYQNLGYRYAYDNRKRFVINTIKAIAKEGSTILDVAAAQGNFSLSLAEQGYEVTWNDIREELVDYVKLKYESGMIHYLPGNILEQDVNAKFDVVLIGEIIEHVAHPDEFMSSIAKFVKDNGHIVMTTPNGEYFRNTLPKFTEYENPDDFESKQFQPDGNGHIFLLHEDEVNNLALHSGLKLESYQLFNNFLSSGFLKTNYLLKYLPRSMIKKIESITQSLPKNIQKKIHTTIGAVFHK